MGLWAGLCAVGYGLGHGSGAMGRGPGDGGAAGCLGAGPRDWGVPGGLGRGRAGGCGLCALDFGLGSTASGGAIAGPEAVLRGSLQGMRRAGCSRLRSSY